MIAEKTLLTLGESVLLSGIGMFVVLMELSILAVMIIILAKVVGAVTGKKKAATAAPKEEITVTGSVDGPTATFTAQEVLPGTVTLDGVDEATAAVVMAIVSSQTGIPLSRLAFRSIKAAPVVLEGVDDATAAVTMAVVSDKTGIPLNRLRFHSIKNVD